MLEAIQIYREYFTPSAALAQPYVMVGLPVLAADTDEHAEQLATSAKQRILRLIRGHRLYREQGRAPRGERIYEAVAGKRRERTSLIAAAQQGKLVAPLVFQGSCDTEVVDAYFEQVLLPELPSGSVIVRDNARFHQSPTTQRLVEAAGCQLRFLPAYAPDLNPIEQLWAAFKTRLRKDLPTAANPFLFIANMCLCYC